MLDQQASSKCLVDKVLLILETADGFEVEDELSFSVYGLFDDLRKIIETSGRPSTGRTGVATYSIFSGGHKFEFCHCSRCIPRDETTRTDYTWSGPILP
ncbi:uncharacterized protein LOC124190107 isoform X2 [Daphnia pulex]|uniref:uncharacterized protein LOC124190107 isoform X2 n=1 Tax=Daphnia pulex TaxID=6669 RepID=UPI001EDDEC5B|nr:uncharacterized protein LOC124190107 isoform X2 [Daphnia pulex]